MLAARGDCNSESQNQLCSAVWGVLPGRERSQNGGALLPTRAKPFAHEGHTLMSAQANCPPQTSLSAA